MLIKKGRKVKCQNCGEMKYKSECYIYEYLDKNFNVKTKNYCSKECCEEKENEKELIDESYKLLNQILDMPVRMNMYFNKLYKPMREHYDIRVIYEFLISEQEYLEKVLYKDFTTNNAKIKYFFAIMQDKINNYKYIIENRNKNIYDELENKEIEIYIEDEFIPKENNKELKKRSINDILNSL